MEANVIKTYNAKLDEKKRLTIRGAKYEHYKVIINVDGVITLKPQILVDLEDISENTLKMIKKSAKSLKEGKVSNPVDLDKFNFDEEKPD